MNVDAKQLISEYAPYFEELRRRLFFLAIFFVLAFILGFFFSGKIIGFFLDFFKVENVHFMIISPFQFMDLAVNTGLFLAVVLTFPLVVYNAFSFLKSALTGKERRFFLSVIPASAFLFCLGFAFGIFIMYYVMQILADFGFRLGLENMWDVSLFSSQILLTAALLGVILQFPIVLTALIRAGVLDVDTLKKKRYWAIALFFIGPALLPPTDGLSLIIIALSMILLFEITLLINRKHKLKKVGVYT